MSRRFWKNRLIRNRFKAPTQVLPWKHYHGFLIRVVNVHAHGQHCFEWQMKPVSKRAHIIAEGHELLRDPTSWTSAKWAMKMGKWDAQDFRMPQVCRF